MTWLLLPYALTLTLAVSGGSVTGTLTGYSARPCPVVGAVDGAHLGLTAICEERSSFPLATPLLPATVVLTLDVDGDLGGAWRLNSGRYGSAQGTLQPH